jgi:hypothetical protein
MIGADTASATAVLSINFKVPKTTPSGGTRMRIGGILSSEVITPCGPHSYGEFEDYRVVIGNDVTPPVITLKGAAVVKLEIGHRYIDSGATAMDNVDGDLTSKITTFNSVDTTVLDTNYVTYVVQDAAGNKATAQRKVIITPDVTPPNVSLPFGTDTVILEVNEGFVDPGILADDNWDHQNVNISTIGTVDTTMIGTYVITYVVTDQSGNHNSIDRVFIVEDTKAPVLSFSRGSSVIVEVFRHYSESDLNKIDNYDTALIVHRSGSFKFNDDVPTKVDTFYLNYTVTDQSGNAASIQRKIKVVDTTAPVMKLIGGPVVHIPRWHVYKDSGYKFTDNYYSKPSRIDSLNTVNTQLPGAYYVTYKATDGSGNKSNEIQRLVIVDENLGIEPSADKDGFGIKAYPNPTSGQFNVTLNLPSEMQARVAIYDMFGKEIQVLHNGMASSATYQVDLSQEAAGVYFVKIETQNKTIVEKIGLVK